MKLKEYGYVPTDKIIKSGAVSYYDSLKKRINNEKGE
jgi:hypothetical protein